MITMKKLDDFTIEIRNTSPSYFGEQLYIVEYSIFKQAILSCTNENLPMVGVFFTHTYTIRPTGFHPIGDITITTWINMTYYEGRSIRLSVTREYQDSGPYNDYSVILRPVDIAYALNCILEWEDDIQPSC